MDITNNDGEARVDTTDPLTLIRGRRMQDTIVAALRCFQTVIDENSVIAKNQHTREWIEDLQHLATRNTKNTKLAEGDVTPEYLDDVIDHLKALFEQSQVTKRVRGTWSDVLDLLEPQTFVVLGSESVGFFPAVVLKVNFQDNSVRLLYHQSAIDRLAITPDENGQSTVDLETPELIRYIGVPHPDPTLEAFAILDVRAHTFLDAIDTSSVPALTYEEVEARLIRLASDRNFTR
jgi:hypothetical protein